MPTQFTWIPLYQELAKELVKWEDRQGDLIAFLEALRERQYTVTSMMDKSEDGARFLLREIDPFTFYGVFNRRIRQDQRVAILSEIQRHFHLQSPLPSDFDGIPVLNNQSSWYFAYEHGRNPDDVRRLWKVFRVALGHDPLNQKEFQEAFDDALQVKRTNINLTMGLFWIRPDTFLNLDRVNRSYLGIKLPAHGLGAKFYLDTVRAVSVRGKSFPQLSFDAWSTSQGVADEPAIPAPGESDYWMVGAYWDDQEPADQTERFLSEGIWENGYHNRFTDEVKSMRVGDKIAIKASATQKNDMPFDNRGKTVSCNIIKAIGTIVANRDDGRTVEVEWESDFKEKRWYFYTNRGTVWHVRPVGKKVWEEAAEKLISFVWFGKAQDYDWFVENWWGAESEALAKRKVEIKDVDITQPYSIEDILAAGVFIGEDRLRQIIDRLNEKKAMIIQGPPGVGKTFVARKVAYALMEALDDSRVELIQFHQSYAYDDFVRGYRPVPGQAGSFALQDGIFYDFCQRAVQDPDNKYVFIIDEINRGNLSQIFGELLMLVENDKRGPQFGVPLVYRKQDESPFYIPSNLYIVGLMNLADRSLAMVDYALRRRFFFFTLTPQYESDSFRAWLEERSMDPALIQHIVGRLVGLNRTIREDPLLGENYQVGHSFFCPKGDDFSKLDTTWYRGIVETEIVPLLKEYWFDNPKKADEASRALLS